MTLEFLAGTEFWKYLSIPFVAGGVGWGTNWLAIQMSYWPLEFVGIYPPWIGWQGIIPSKARKMSSIAVDSTLSKLASLREIFDHLDPERIARHVVDTFAPRMDEMSEQLIREREPELWDQLPAGVQQAILYRMRQQLPRLVHSLIDDLRNRIDEVMDLKDMVLRQLVRNKSLLNRMFLECGAEETRFLINSGLWFGFLFGIPQTFVWYFFPTWWTLPMAGLFVGYVTNWLALNMIFRPLEPTRIGPFVLQGLFLRRQREIAATYSRLITTEVLTIRNFTEEMLNGPKGDRTRALVRQHVEAIADETVGFLRPALEMAVGREDYAGLKQTATQRAIDLAPTPFDDAAFNQERSAVVERVTREKLEEMTPAEFQELLRPAFQEDEYKLILVGAALGFVAGWLQLVLVFGGVSG